MKKTHIGIDIIEIGRIGEAISRWQERFLRRIYTDSELALCRDRVESLAVRFAGKEAAVKALSAPNISWRDLEILSEMDGKPVVHLHGPAQERARELGLVGLEISLSHSREYAIAMVIGVSED
jgi:holo-[acyl-carrier protein] synthase